MQHTPSESATRLRTELAPLRGLWRGIENDLLALGIQHVSDLHGRSAEALLKMYCEASGRPYDPVLRSCFVSLVRFSETGVAEPWWRIMRAEAQQEQRALTAAMIPSAVGSTA
jgi:hypothetical protein